MKNIKIIIAIIVTLVVLQSCDSITLLMLPEQDWTVSMDSSINSKEAVFEHTSKIEYKLAYDTWPTPPTVDATMKGDCKGYSILAIQMLKQLGIEAQFVEATVMQGGQTFRHALVYFNGGMWEPQAKNGYVPSDMTIVSYNLWNYKKLKDTVRLANRSLNDSSDWR